MHLRNGEHGYGVVTKVLHWLTVALVVAQFAVGLTMSADDAPVERAEQRLTRLAERLQAGRERAEERFERRRERLEAAAEARGDAAADRLDARTDRLEDRYRARQEAQERRAERQLARREAALDAEEDSDVSGLHIGLGTSLLLVALLRLLWRRTTPLPPWAEHLSAGERSLESRLEKALLALLVVVPLSGLLLLVVGTDWLPLHVGAQLLLLAAIAGHAGLVLTHTLVRRHRHLSRML